MSTDFSKKALLKFLDTVVEKGLMNANTAGGLRAACTKILDDVEDDNDVRVIDVATAVIRYNNRNPGVLAPNSLAEYQRRVTRAIMEFVRYTENPVGYKPLSRTIPGKNGKKTEAKAEKKERVMHDQHTQPTPPHQGSPIQSGTTGLALHFPLRGDFLAQVVIPRDLNAEEAKRMCAFLMTLAMDYRPADSSDLK